MSEQIELNQSVENLTDEKLKEIRLSFDPDSMGFSNNLEEGVIYED